MTGIQITSGGAIHISGPEPLAHTIEVCPIGDMINATFENVGVDTCDPEDLGCVPDRFCACTGNPVLKYITFTDISVNGTFELENQHLSGDIQQWEGAGGDLHVAKYADIGCPGSPLLECDLIGVSRIVVQCIGRPTSNPYEKLRTILYYVPSFDVCIPGWSGGNLLIFRNISEYVVSGVATTIGAINFNMPDDNGLDSCGTSASGGFGAATGGTVTFTGET